ncbi:metallophosphoesterase [Ruegeria atlantica]|nr:metallophosphoesterase [Ruegeria atlantica]
MYHIIPDIHGQADKLDGLLEHLGWRQKPSGWIGPSPEQRIMFLGDFIDRGPDNRRVIDTVRSLIDGGKALAIMGNHEFNAIHYHTQKQPIEATENVRSTNYLRRHSEKNERQHRTFLNEFPVGASETQEVIKWMTTLPLFLEVDGFRAVHACWAHDCIDIVRKRLPGAKIGLEMLQQDKWKSGELWDAMQVLTSGVEVELPQGHTFLDKDGNPRHHVRIGWWLSGANTWREIAQSVPNPSQLPKGALSDSVQSYQYKDETPVFFGHYWLTGNPVKEAEHAICLDYSAGTDGPLIAYEFHSGDNSVELERIVTVPA